MIFNSAGHHEKDSGAVATHCGITYKENELAIMMRDGISAAIRRKGYKVIEDNDKETLSQYLNRIKPGTGSVVGESHFNSFADSKASGIEIVIPDNYDKYDYQFARMVAVGLHKITGLRLRNGQTGVITESQSARGKLGFLRKPGINAIFEYGFISNPNDIQAILENKEKIYEFMADCYIMAENWLT